VVAKKLDAEILEVAYDPEAWSLAMQGLENEPEGGARCIACFRFRLERAAAAAAREGFDAFATTLTVSPHKDAVAINLIGNEAVAGAAYVESDFKKKDGFKRSVEMSKELGLYRQNYCGCVYSRMKNDKLR
jgi:predicted adenine nucleotide alpha hydrolase (AANH) superfamily ATPase